MADAIDSAGAEFIHLRDGAVRTYDFDPAELDMPRATVADLRGGTPDESAQMMRELLSGTASAVNGARRDAVLLNAAGALAAESGDFKSALDEARLALDSGKALAKLNALVEFSQSFAQAAAA